MSTDYGKKIGRALQAVLRMHMDTSRLLQDCDKLFSDEWGSSIFGGTATSALAYNVYGPWIAQGVFRYFEHKEDCGRVAGLTVCFLDISAERVDEPLLLLSESQYRVEEGSDTKSVCEHWDTWYTYFDWSVEPSPGKVVRVADAKDGKIEWARVLAVPLYSISSVECVQKAFAQLREADV